MRDEEAPPDLRERVGVAVRGTTPGALEMVAALGAATLKLPAERLEMAEQPKWDRDRRLAELLWRIAGKDMRARHEAAIVFSARLRRHHMFCNFAGGDKTLIAFAKAVIVEWEHDRCASCGGTGLENPDPTEPIARNTHRTKRCEKCKAWPGREPVDHPARARALGLISATMSPSPREVYDKYWRRRFDWAHDLLRAIEPKIESHLRKQRGLGTIRAK